MKLKIFPFIAAFLTIGALPSYAIAPSIPGCTPEVTEFTNSTITAIADNATTNSTLAVSATNGTIIDIDLLTNITHTNNADLDISLTSPTGTVVTVTTDNGGNNDDVFNGTYWDDQADSATQLGAAAAGSGFVGNAAYVARHTFSDTVLATPLVPEEGFAAFKGESANGNWTLRIVDDLATETGSLASWKLKVTTCTTTPATKTLSFSNATAQAIADHALISSSVTASGLGSGVCGVKVTTNITHTFSADIEMALVSPFGTHVTLTDDQGSSANDVFAGTVWQQDADPGSSLPYSGNPGIVSDHTYTDLTLASPLTPMESFAAFYGEQPNGVWTLVIHDDAGGDTGTFNSWSLELKSCSNDADQDGVADQDDKCTGADTDTDASGVADCLESDLVPTDVKAKLIKGKLQCSFSVQNKGAVAAAASTAEIRFAVASDSIGKLKSTIAVPALAAGAKSAKFTVNKAPGGANFCRFVVDSASALTEKNETNNSKWKRR